MGGSGGGCACGRAFSIKGCGKVVYSLTVRAPGKEKQKQSGYSILMAKAARLQVDRLRQGQPMASACSLGPNVVRTLGISGPDMEYRAATGATRVQASLHEI